jgi:catechol 2,3-dioxygenase-like lactoylglutathione lyase family enzyme
MRIEAVPDHVAVAVDDPGAVQDLWRDRLGGGHVRRFDFDSFVGLQLRYANEVRLELVGPPPDAPEDNFLRRFLARFGAQLHHVTLLVPDLVSALATVEAADLEAVDVALGSDQWKEAFLRPSQIGGLVVQVAQASWTDDGRGRPAPGAAALLGPRLRHPRLADVRRIWTLLGADVGETADGLLCAWQGSPLTVLVEEGEPAGPVALRMTGTESVATSPPIEGDVTRP